MKAVQMIGRQGTLLGRAAPRTLGMRAMASSPSGNPAPNVKELARMAQLNVTNEEVR
jgi:hypothetical protein